MIDAPNARKIHSAPVPLLGGAAIYAAFILGLIVLGDRGYFRELVGILLGATLVSLFGLADDRWGLHAYLKLGGQAAGRCGADPGRDAGVPLSQLISG